MSQPDWTDKVTPKRQKRVEMGKMENGRFLRSLELRLPGTLFGGNQYAI